MTEGDKHVAAVNRLITLLRTNGFVVYKDMRVVVETTRQQDTRADTYYPDVMAFKPYAAIEVNGNVGHSSKRSYDNEQIQKQQFEAHDIKFFAYSPEELAGRGYTNSKGKRHKPHKDDLLLQEWGIKRYQKPLCFIQE